MIGILWYINFLQPKAQRIMAKSPASVLFKVGDQVELLSGGPIMTVTEILTYGNREVRCSWFSGKKLETGEFPSGALKPAVKESTDAES